MSIPCLRNEHPGSEMFSWLLNPLRFLMHRLPETLVDSAPTYIASRIHFGGEGEGFWGPTPQRVRCKHTVDLGGGSCRKSRKKVLFRGHQCMLSLSVSPHCSEVEVVIIVIDISRLDDDTMVRALFIVEGQFPLIPIGLLHWRGWGVDGIVHPYRHGLFVIRR